MFRGHIDHPWIQLNVGTTYRPHLGYTWSITRLRTRRAAVHDDPGPSFCLWLHTCPNPALLYLRVQVHALKQQGFGTDISITLIAVALSHARMHARMHERMHVRVHERMPARALARTHARARAHTHASSKSRVLLSRSSMARLRHDGCAGTLHPCSNHMHVAGPDTCTHACGWSRHMHICLWLVQTHAHMPVAGPDTCTYACGWSRHMHTCTRRARVRTSPSLSDDTHGACLHACLNACLHASQCACLHACLRACLYTPAA